jgi:hypothetical protein
MSLAVKNLLPRFPIPVRRLPWLPEGFRGFPKLSITTS